MSSSVQLRGVLDTPLSDLCSRLLSHVARACSVSKGAARARSCSSSVGSLHRVRTAAVLVSWICSSEVEESLPLEHIKIVDLTNAPVISRRSQRPADCQAAEAE